DMGSFPLAQDDEVSLEGGFDLGSLGDLGSLTDLLEAFRVTTFSGLSNLKKEMANRGLDLIETPGMELDSGLLLQFAGVFIISPTEGFNSTEIDILRDFTSTGGKLIIFGDQEGKTNLTGLNPLLNAYGYSMWGEHSEENTTDIVVSTALGAGLEAIWLGGGTYILNNQSLANARLDGLSVVLLDDSAPEIALFGSSRIFMNKNLVKCNNSILLHNLNEYLLVNTLTGVATLSENTTYYEAGKSVYLNVHITDYFGDPVNDLFVAIAFELPNGSLTFFIAGFVEDGLYSSQFASGYWESEGTIHGIFVILGGEEYANTFAGISFNLYEPESPTTTGGPSGFLSMPQIALITSVGIFGGFIVSMFTYRSRRRKRMRIAEIEPDLVRDIDNALNVLLAAFTQIEHLIQREDLDRIQKIESLRSLMVTIEEGRKLFEQVSEKVGGV
ncbi:MAG: DUF4350 domain-containing protein, partial [Candidatus Hodarchaeota archaeon]